MAITRFRGEHAFLSNFHPAPITVQGMSFPTVEHAYQAAKLTTDMPVALRREAQLAICDLASPALAKKWGRKIPIRSDWDKVKQRVMYGCLVRKFATNPLLGQLWATHPHELVEGNDWGDTYWGVCNGRGWNMLGKMLMAIRDQPPKGGDRNN